MGITAFNRYRNRRREHVQRTTQADVQPQAQTTTEGAEIRHIGGGWFEVNGERYQGREAAEEAAANQE